jgi:hypothetical protein
VVRLYWGLLRYIVDEKIIRTEVTFEILKVRTVITREKEWIELDIQITDQTGTRKTTVREGDVLKAEFDITEERKE